jgi:hypothetical protein
VGGQVIYKDDNVAFPQGRHQRLLNIGEAVGAIHGAIDDVVPCETADAKCSNIIVDAPGWGKTMPNAHNGY